MTSVLLSVISFLVIYASINTICYIKNKDNYSHLEHFQYIVLRKEYEESIQNVDNYIINNEKDVKILSADASSYMIPINRYNKNYDMLLKGNLGENSEAKLIEDITNTSNRQYLVLKEEFIENWQFPLNITDYVKLHKNTVGK